MATKKKRITISLSEKAYDNMISIIDAVNSKFGKDFIESKSDYIEALINHDYLYKWNC